VDTADAWQVLAGGAHAPHDPRPSIPARRQLLWAPGEVIRRKLFVGG